MKTTDSSVAVSAMRFSNPCGSPQVAAYSFMKYASVVLLFLILCVGQAWGSDPTYKTDFKATGGATGKGYVYAGTSNTATPVYVETSDDIAVSNDTKSATGTNKYYAWAKAVRGSEFNGWTIAGSNEGVTPTSGTASPITVTVTSNMKNGTNTGTATATWTTYAKVNVTYNPSEDGIYSVTYQYNSYDATTKEITTGDAENLSRTISSENGAQTIGSYNNDVITLKSTSGTFQGWYSDAGFGSLLSTANPYTYTAPTSGSAAVYPKYEHVDKYYGRLTASIAEVPYSMPGGGTIFISKEEAGTGTYSADAQTVDNIGMGTTGLKYYLHAQPNDKRYVFRGWYSDAACTSLISTNADYAYTFTSSSTNSASPTLGNVYAAFDFNLYYMQVEVEPAVPGLGMVFVKDDNSTTPVYTEYTTHSEQFLYAYRLAPTANAYLYAKPKYGYKFSGWYDNPDCTGSAKSTANPYTFAATGTSTDPMNPTIIKLYAKFVEDASTVNITYNKPDQTKGEYTASVLDIAEVDDDFVWTFKEVFTSVGKSANTTQAQHKTDVLRLEAQPKAGYGVTSWTIAGTAKTTPSQLYETTGTAVATYGVAFGDAKPFLVCATTAATTGIPYASLREALDNLGSNKKIVVVQNAYVPAGEYIIPSGVTLLVPFDEAQTLYTTKPGITKAAPSGQSAYCTLTLGNGANVKVNGAISVSAHQNKGQPYGGAVTGKYGKIELKEGANITLNNGSFLYCWGYITGAGTVDALNGSTVYEDFQIACWRGGTAASSMERNSKKVFPLQQYYIQNIEAKINFHYGSSEIVYTGVTISYVDPEGSAKIIGTSNCLFQLKSGSILTKWFDASKDRQMYLLNGDATLGYVEVSISVTVDSRDYILPLTNNMDITINSGSTFTCDYDFAVLPGASITINEGAKVSLGSNCRAYLYDKSEWPEKTTGFNYPGNVAFYKIAYTDTKITTARTYANMADAKFDVNGTLEVNKAIYTTAGGADICSSKGTGNIQFKAAAGTETVTYQATQSGSSISYTSIPITSAKLHNGDDSYTLTAGSVSGDKFIYSKPQEKWLKNPKVVSWNANGGTTDASTMAYSEGAFVGELPAAYKDGYTLEGWYTAADGGTQIEPTTKVTANATYYAHWTPKTYTISYRDQGGAAFTGTHVDSPKAHPTTHTFGTATTLNNATKEHYTLGGWYRTPSCSGAQVTTIAATECKNITLYAKWTINTHKLTWNMDGGATSSSAYTAAGDAVAYGTTITYPAASTMTKTNYVFNSWDKSISTMPDEDLTITAQWVPAVASVTVGGNTTYHATVADAIAAANGKTNAVVTMLKNASVSAQVNVTAAMTIDLNGKMVSSTLASATGVFNINASGKTVTIRDSQTGGKIDHTASYAGGYMYGINLTAGTLNIESGTIYAKNTANNRAYGIYNAGSTTLNISRGTIEATSTNSPFGIYDNSNCTLTMTGGAFTANGPTSRGIYTKGATKLTGATITSSGTDSYAIFAKAGTMIINSGTYTATGTSSYAIYYEAGTVTVNGGKFSGATGELKPKTSYGTNVKLQGGYYVHNTDIEANCATNYHVLPLEGEDPYKYEVAEAYTITFKNGDEVLQSGLIKKGTTPTYDGETPTKDADAQYTYTFNEWSQAIAAVTADATYTAQFSSTPRTYTVTLNVNGGTINAGAVTEYTYGTGATLPTDVTKEGHTFGGWFDNGELTGDAVTSISNTATGDKTYWAKWTKLHAITWMTEGNVPLRTDYVADGEMPSYGQPNPAKDPTEQYTFTFEGWSPAVVVATEDASYTAQFQDHTRYYTITWKNYNGTVLKTDQNMQYGDPVSYDGDTPTKSGDVQHFYAFKGWYPEVTPSTLVSGDQVYVAQFGVALTVGVGENTEYEVYKDEEVVATTVQVAGHLKVPAGASLTTTDLILEATPSTSGEITGAERVNVKGNAYFDLKGVFKAHTWYAVAVPWQVDVPAYDKTKCGVLISNEGSSFVQQELGRTVDLIYYDGAERAKNGHSNACWRYIEDDNAAIHIMYPGRAYMIYLASDATVIRFKKKADASIHTSSFKVYPYSGRDRDANWNGIANPATFQAYINPYASTSGIVNAAQIYDGDKKSFSVVNLKDYGKLVVGKPVFVQVPEEKTVVANPLSYEDSPSPAPRRVKEHKDMMPLEVSLVANESEKNDRIIIHMSDDKEEDSYIVGKDLMKMGVSDIIPQMWVDRYDSRLCINTVAPVNDVATYPLSLFAPKADEYTVSTDATAEDNVTLYLTFDGRPIWNLTYSPYVTSLEKGTNRHYGLMLIRSKAPEVATGMGEVQDGTQPAAQKILLDGQVYILRGGELYSITGQSIK